MAFASSTTTNGDSPFLSAGVALWEAGYSPIPLEPGTKVPGVFVAGHWEGMPSWQRFCTTRATEEEVDTWCHWPHAGLGLACGPAGGVVVADYDTDDERWQNKVLSVLPVSLIRKRGVIGFTAFYQWSGEHSRDFRAPDGTKVVQILSAGRQTVLPNSIHPDGMLYVWQTPDTLLDVRPGDLPALPKNFADVIADALDPRRVQRQSAGAWTKQRRTSTVSVERVRAALQHIPADDYDLWIRVGFALRSEFSGGDGFHLWDAWSRSSAVYAKNKSGEVEKRWLGFDESGGPDRVNIDTVFWLAQEHGWIEPTQRNTGPEVSPVDVQPGGNLEALFRRARGESEPAPKAEPYVNGTTPPPPRNERGLPEELVRSAPGLVGRIATWLDETAIYPHPAIALGAALCTVGSLKSHRVKTPSGLRTNLLIFGVAPSTSGKGHYMRAAKALLKQAGLENLIGGKPTSDSAVLKMLRNGNGRRLVPWDEVGLGLAAITHQNAGSHQAAIMQVIMELFSEADSVYIGKEYADHDGRMSRKDIDQPALTVFGTTTDAALYAAFQSKHAQEGFLPRWLAFETSCLDPKRRRGGSISDAPPELIAEMQDIERLPTNIAPRGNIDQLLEIRPRAVPFSPAADTLLEESLDYFDRRKADTRNQGMDSFWGRAGEHASKLALTAHDDRLGAEVSVEELRWALAVARHCVDTACRELEERVSDTKHESSLKRVWSIIRNNPGIPTRALTRATRWLTNKERADILRTLQEGDDITVVEEKHDGAGRPTMRFTCQE